MKTKVQLSFMMFVEWFIWGAWFVPLWLWMSKSGFTAGEIGWSYACTAIAAILSPILVGSLTDRFFAAQKVLAVLMFAGAILMYFAAQQTQFSTFFPLLLVYSLTYMPTIALTNSIAFANVDDVEADFPRIRVMGTIGWIASGLACGFLPQMMGYSDISDTNIPLLMTAASSALLGVFALFLPLADRVELTDVLARIDGDTLMPDPRLSSEWKETEIEVHPSENGRPAFRFVSLERY